MIAGFAFQLAWVLPLFRPPTSTTHETPVTDGSGQTGALQAAGFY